MKTTKILLVLLLSVFTYGGVSAQRFKGGFEAGTAFSTSKGVDKYPSFWGANFNYKINDKFSLVSPFSFEYLDSGISSLTLGLGTEYNVYKFTNAGSYSLLLKGGSSIFNYKEGKNTVGNYAYGDFSFRGNHYNGGFIGVGVKKLFGYKEKTVNNYGYLIYTSIGFNL